MSPDTAVREDTDSLEQLWDEPEFATPCEGFPRDPCSETAVVVMVSKRLACNCAVGKSYLCMKCLRRVLHILMNLNYTVYCWYCHGPAEYVGWYYL